MPALEGKADIRSADLSRCCTSHTQARNWADIYGGDWGMAGIEVRRSGRTSNRADLIYDANLKLARGNGLAEWSYKGDGISLTFQVNGGKGKSQMIVWVPPEAFPDLVAAMLEGSPKPAEQAFLSALLKRARKRTKS